MRWRNIGVFSFLSLFIVSCLFSEVSRLTTGDINKVMDQLFAYHIDKKEMTPIVLERSLKIYLDQFDPSKAYLLDTEVAAYLHPKPEILIGMLEEYKKGVYTSYFALNSQIQVAIYRAREWRKGWLSDPVSLVNRAKSIKIGDEDFTRSFARHESDLKTRHQTFFLQLLALNIDHIAKPIPPGKEAKLVALCERQIRQAENGYLGLDDQGGELPRQQQEHLVVLRTLKSLAKSLDAHTAYFSPEEAYAMKVQLEKGMCGIGVVLSEGIDGVTISEIIKGGPAEKCGQLKTGDTIVEIDGESIRDFSFSKVLEVLRGDEGSKMVLGIARNAGTPGDRVVKVTLIRSKITLGDKRVDIHSEPFGDGVIGKITLHSFYEGEDGVSSEKDIRHAIEQLKKEGPLYGVVLDLRDNTGGFLSQAVRVSGLFISGGVVVISKYSDGTVKYYRAVDGKPYYDGPLVVLISKGSASATEIVAQTLQDYGVAVVAGDETSYGKGTIQHQTITNDRTNSFFKVTVGRYYTVSGKSTQIGGVKSDIVIPTEYKFAKIGEGYLDFPIPAEDISSAFEDPLTDLDPYAQKWFKKYYTPIIQKPISFWKERLPILKENSEKRLAASKNYQLFLEAITPAKGEAKKKRFGVEDLQMAEAVKVCQDMVILKQKSSFIVDS